MSKDEMLKILGIELQEGEEISEETLEELMNGGIDTDE